MSELDRIYKKLEMLGRGIIQKSVGGGETVDRPTAVAKACETPEGAVLMKRVIELQKQEALARRYPWMFEKSDEEDIDGVDDLAEELRRLRHREAEILQALKMRGADDFEKTDLPVYDPFGGIENV